jgi:hypothetical protein
MLKTLRQKRLRGLVALIFLVPLFLGVSSLGGCSSVTTTEVIIKPIDNGMAVPGVLVLIGYDEKKDRYEGMLIGEDQELVYMNKDDVNGAIIMPRNRALELLAKEGGFALLLENHPELIEIALKLTLDEESRLRKLAEAKN